MTDFLSGYGATFDWLSVGLLACLAVVLPFAAIGFRGRHARRQTQSLAAILDNIPQGVCLFDAGARIVVCNRRYVEMYHLSPDVVKPGCTLYELILHRQATGLFTGDAEEYCRGIIEQVAKGRTRAREVETSDGRTVKGV